ATADITVTANATAEHKNIQGPALTVNPAEYTVAVVANNSIVPLLNDDLIRPLDDLVAKYGQSLQPNQLIKIDGKVMAIAFMGNGQH
ncbi:MAG: sugar ABC transporter substrate-binding protein, partial [Pseudomonadota bacterium]